MDSLIQTAEIPLSLKKFLSFLLTTLPKDDERSNIPQASISTDEFPQHGERNKQPSRPLQYLLSTLITFLVKTHLFTTLSALQNFTL
jgi:hypothetical protein